MATRAEQSCFDNGILLTIHETGLTRYDINEKNEWDYFFRLDMPRDVTCTQCILQWKYNAGLSFVINAGKYNAGLSFVRVIANSVITTICLAMQISGYV